MGGDVRWRLGRRQFPMQYVLLGGLEILLVGMHTYCGAEMRWYICDRAKPIPQLARGSWGSEDSVVRCHGWSC